MSTQRMRITSVSTLAALALLTGLPHTAQAQANLSFSGGSGAPLTLVIGSPITYTIHTPVTLGDGPAFVFQGVGDLFSNTFPLAISSVTFRINGGAPQGVDQFNSGLAIGSVALNDVYVFGALPGLSAGDVVTLLSGTMTTTTNIAAPAPTDGLYTTFIAQTGGVPVSNLGTSAPEPGTLALLALGGSLALVKRRRK